MGDGSAHYFVLSKANVCLTPQLLLGLFESSLLQQNMSEDGHSASEASEMDNDTAASSSDEDDAEEVSGTIIRGTDLDKH